MAANPLFKAAPNQISNQTIGWTSKTIFSYQYSQEMVGVSSGDNIFQTLANAEVAQKGQIQFEENYFAKPNINSGRTIKITMYFQITQNSGYAINLDTGLFDMYLPGDILIGPSQVANLADTNGAISLCRYEAYLNVYEDPTIPDIFLQVTGGILFPATDNYQVRNTAINGRVSLPSGYVPRYILRIYNNCGADIYISSLIVEEIG